MDLLAVLYAGRYQGGKGEKHAVTRRREEGGGKKEGKEGGERATATFIAPGRSVALQVTFPPVSPGFSPLTSGGGSKTVAFSKFSDWFERWNHD